MSDLSSLKVGDKVCLAYAIGWNRRLVELRTGTVEAVGKSQIKALGNKWLIRNGAKVGGGTSYRNDYLRIWTPELQAEADRGAKIFAAEKTVYALSKYFGRLKDDEVLEIIALLPPELLAKVSE